jgi:hypothetical protein
MIDCDIIMLFLDGCRDGGLFYVTVSLISCIASGLPRIDSQNRLTGMEIGAVALIYKRINNMPLSADKHIYERI